jgi:hypothetical protein
LKAELPEWEVDHPGAGMTAELDKTGKVDG